ncbi:MAG: hypothetical protein AAGG02_12890 [Cyanobacteria bacterium P01_H01_bin.15]
MPVLFRRIIRAFSLFALTVVLVIGLSWHVAAQIASGQVESYNPSTRQATISLGTNDGLSKYDYGHIELTSRDNADAKFIAANVVVLKASADSAIVEVREKPGLQVDIARGATVLVDAGSGLARRQEEELLAQQQTEIARKRAALETIRQQRAEAERQAELARQQEAREERLAQARQRNSQIAAAPRAVSAPPDEAELAEQARQQQALEAQIAAETRRQQKLETQVAQATELRQQREQELAAQQAAITNQELQRQAEIVESQLAEQKRQEELLAQIKAQEELQAALAAEQAAIAQAEQQRQELAQAQAEQERLRAEQEQRALAQAQAAEEQRQAEIEAQLAAEEQRQAEIVAAQERQEQERQAQIAAAESQQAQTLAEARAERDRRQQELETAIATELARQEETGFIRPNQQTAAIQSGNTQLGTLGAGSTLLSGGLDSEIRDLWGRQSLANLETGGPNADLPEDYLAAYRLARTQPSAVNYYNFARTLIDYNLPEQAISWLDETAETFPDTDGQNRLYRAVALVELGQPQDALAELDQIKEPFIADSQLAAEVRSYTLAAMGDWQSVLAIAEDTQSPTIWNNYLIAQYCQNPPELDRKSKVALKSCPVFDPEQIDEPSEENLERIVALVRGSRSGSDWDSERQSNGDSATPESRSYAQDPYILNTLGFLSLQVEDYRNAYTYYERLAKQLDDDPDPRLRPVKADAIAYLENFNQNYDFLQDQQADLDLLRAEQGQAISFFALRGVQNVATSIARGTTPSLVGAVVQSVVGIFQANDRRAKIRAEQNSLLDQMRTNFGQDLDYIPARPDLTPQQSPQIAQSPHWPWQRARA